MPYQGCGSKASCSVCASTDNILVIQSDAEVQEIWDTARKITCDGIGTAGSKSSGTGLQHTNEEKTIIFKPFVVDALEVVSVPTARGGIDCWMDIQRGQFPNVSPLTEVIKIGEALSVMVFLRDPLGDYDLMVRDCYAFDSDDYEAKTTGHIQLSDKRGCSRKRKIFGTWQRTTETANTGATLILFNTLQAFKFPDRMQVFLKCDVEVSHKRWSDKMEMEVKFYFYCDFTDLQRWL